MSEDYFSNKGKQPIRSGRNNSDALAPTDSAASSTPLMQQILTRTDILNFQPPPP